VPRVIVFSAVAVFWGAVVLGVALQWIWPVHSGRGCSRGSRGGLTALAGAVTVVLGKEMLEARGDERPAGPADDGDRE